MKAKLIVEGKEFDIEINNPELQKLVKPPKKTGYERAGRAQVYFSTYPSGKVDTFTYTDSIFDNEVYSGANYYSDRIVAENNARADKLMRQLRRFAVEHREHNFDWTDDTQSKYYIGYNHYVKKLGFYNNFVTQSPGVVYFDSKEIADLAIETFRDELIWYFTEYKDSL